MKYAFVIELQLRLAVGKAEHNAKLVWNEFLFPFLSYYWKAWAAQTSSIIHPASGEQVSCRSRSKKTQLYTTSQLLLNPTPAGSSAEKRRTHTVKRKVSSRRSHFLSLKYRPSLGLIRVRGWDFCHRALVEASSTAAHHVSSTMGNAHVWGVPRVDCVSCCTARYSNLPIPSAVQQPAIQSLRLWLL